MHVLYIELSMRLLLCEVAPARPGMGALKFGIRAKVSTLNLDWPIEWSLDQGFEEKLCLEGQFWTFEFSRVLRSYLTMLPSSRGVAVL
jgi:hypothetical protein